MKKNFSSMPVSIQLLNTNNVSSVILHGTYGYYFPRGWVESIHLRDGKNQPPFRLIGDGEQLGNVAEHGVWSATSHPRDKRHHTPLFEATVPKAYHGCYINLNHYKEIVVEFLRMPTFNEMVFDQFWCVPLWLDTKELVFTNHFAVDHFVADFQQRYKAQRQFPVLKLKKRLLPIRPADPLPSAPKSEPPAQSQTEQPKTTSTQ
jgi:hypothetical protein